MSPLTWVFLLMTAVSLVLYAYAALALRLHLSRRPALPAGPLPPLSLVKPIAGLEEALEENLRSFFEHAYPGPVEVVLSSLDPGDPGMRVARRVARDYPGVPSRFVWGDARFGLNPKVANLAPALAAARYDRVLITDANVRVRPGVVQALVAEMLEERASLLGALVVGSGERSAGAALEALHLGSVTSALMCAAARLAGHPCVVGKALLLGKRELEAVGGLAAVKDVLAEDYELGMLFRAAGRRVCVARTAVDNVNIRRPVGEMVGRHLRWLRMRRTISVVGFAADLAVNPLLWALGVWGAGGGWGSGLVLAIAAGKAWFDGSAVARLRGAGMGWYRCLAPVRDLLIVGVWMAALFGRQTVWRGRRLRIWSGSRIEAVGLGERGGEGAERVGVSPL